MRIKSLAFLIILMWFGHLSTSQAQPTQIDHVAPPFWWVGMENPNLQIMVHGDNISKFNVSTKHKGVKVKEVHRLDNPNYLFVDLTIDDRKAEADTLVLLFKKGKELFTHSYELKERIRDDDSRIQGLTSKDVIYLIMPDRFANGDVYNDYISGMKDVGINRDSAIYRHGGDFKGIIKHLDYVQKLGATAVWLNPVLLNDQPSESYHGYAATDHFKVDPRLGGTKGYMSFVRACHDRGLKVVMDVIHNHTGDQHWFIQDQPASNWIHKHEEFTRTHYRAPTIFDPYASETDKRTLKEGWFGDHLPDLNQNNPFLATYLIQSNIWWIEHTGIDGFRMDTYAFSEDAFLEKWGQAIAQEYDDFTVFGETWVYGSPTQAYFHGKNKFKQEFNSSLSGVTDFQLYYATIDALNEQFGWTEGISRLYYALTKDYLYEDPSKNVIFLDNHDLPRFFSMVGEDIKKYKLGMTFLLTTRGIPCIYYGTEVLMRQDPILGSRADFPGGFPADTSTKFTHKGRTSLENEAYNFTKNLINWRRQNKVIHEGQLMQFIPEEGLYVFFRYTDDDAVMVVMNSNNYEVILNTDKYQERLEGYSKGRDVFTGNLLHDITQLRIPARSPLVLDLEPDVLILEEAVSDDQ